ncbi:MAG: heterodisulfide reductase-related iron-sulfur binding cluster [Ilumatobacteraceae bacterium]
MTTTYDPTDAAYADEADTRAEMSRVFDVCHGCRRCVDLCSVFPSLFDLIERRAQHDPSADLLTPADQDGAAGACRHCSLCAVRCPYLPASHEANVDFPRLMQRAAAMRLANGHTEPGERAAARFLGRIDQLGRTATRVPTVSSRVLGARSGSLRRRAVARVSGASAVRPLPQYARQRFSAWFAKRPKVSLARAVRAVTVYPTCLVDYQQPAIGHDLVKVYERNGVECDVSRAGCCGAPSLHAGDVERFREIAERNVERLAQEVRAGGDIVVPQPTCGSVIKHDYPHHVPGPDAELVASRTHDASEYLVELNRSADASLDIDFDGQRFGRITYHAPCHLRAQGNGLRSRDLLRLTGARVTVVQQCSGIDGLWGLRAGNEDESRPAGERLGDEIDRAGGDIVAGDCHLSNVVIEERTGEVPLHPLQILARAYGISPETC